MSNDDWQIVPERDQVLSSRARPAKSAENRRSNVARSAKSDKKAGGSSILLICLLALSFAASGFLFYLLRQSQAAQVDMAGRVAVIEGKLSVTDESLSQSGAAMQAILKDHATQLETQMTEIRKLWGVAYDTNRKAIEELKVTTGTLTTTLSTTKDQLTKFATRIDGLGSQSLILAADIEAAMTSVRQSRDEITKQTTLISKLNAQSADNLEAIKSIDAFRSQINQRIVQLEQEIRSTAGDAAR